MKNCKTCKHWGVKHHRATTDTSNPCRWPEIEHYDAYTDFTLKRSDGFALSDEIALFETGPEFGCIHWGAND